MSSQHLMQCVALGVCLDPRQCPLPHQLSHTRVDGAEAGVTGVLIEGALATQLARPEPPQLQHLVIH